MDCKGINTSLLIVILVVLVGIGGFLALSGGETKEEFGLSNFEFCSEEPMGYMNYTEQPDNQYSLGDTIWIYVNANNEEYNMHSDGSFEVWLQNDWTLKAPNGEAVSLPGSPIHENFSASRNPSEFYLQYDLTFTSENIPLGQYTVEATVTDELSGENAEASGTFTLEE